MRIVWDEQKDRGNRAKHGVSFELASLVFGDPLQMSEHDPCEGEERWRTLGLVKGVIILHVVHTVKEEENGEEETGSYRQERPPRLKEKRMKTGAKRQGQELAALVRLRDEDIDTSDIPEVKDWSRAVVGKFFRPIKEPVTLRIDVDVLAWLKSEGPGYQTRINTLLREAMAAHSRTGRLEGREAGAATPSPVRVTSSR